MKDDEFQERLRDVARSLPVPDAPPDLIERVIAQRAAGARITLPSTPPPSRRVIRLAQVAALAAAAAGITIAAALSVGRHGTGQSASTAADSISSIERFFINTGVAPSAAYAQTPSPAPGAPPIAGIDGLSLGGRVLEYRTQFVDSVGRITPDGDGVVRIVAARHDNTPVWRVERLGHITDSNGQRRIEGETLFVSRRELRPIARVVHQTPYRRFSSIHIAQRFVGDSVLGEMTTDNGIRRPIARLLPKTFAPYVADALAPVALSGVQLDAQWRGSASVVGWAVIATDVFYPATLRVVGEESLNTPGGPVDCWKLYVSAGSEQRFEWVRKSDGLALRSVDAKLSGPKGRREFLLLNP